MSKFYKKNIKQLIKKSLSILLFLSFSNISFASQCFIAKEKHKVLKIEGGCEKRYSPCSTFKIALSLIGFDSKILKDEQNPKWEFKQGYVDWRENWKYDHVPQSWMKNSCVWYSQELTKKIGMDEFQKYINKFDYGNMDLSGDIGKDNGITNSWLSSSLEISSLEQVGFLEKLVNNELPVSEHATFMTKNILFVEDLSDGWRLYGKTGMGSLLSSDRTTKLDINHGWFIGWIEKGDRKIIFSNHIVDDKKEEESTSIRAREDTKKKLKSIIDDK